MLIYILVYVDDIIVTENQYACVEEFIKFFKLKFSVKDLGNLNFFLGVEVNHTAISIFLSLQNYIQEFLELAQIKGENSVTTPLSPTTLLKQDDSTHLDDVTLFWTIVDKLQYLLLTRPNIAFVVNKLALFTSRPTINHWSTIKRLLWYLNGTYDASLFLKRNSFVCYMLFSILIRLAIQMIGHQLVQTSYFWVVILLHGHLRSRK